MHIMQKIKKGFMLTVKFVVGLFPKTFRLWLKRSPYLTSLYSRSLQKSGLFYGFPSRKKLEALYYRNRQHQENILVKISAVNCEPFNVIVIVADELENKLKATIGSLNQLVNTKVNLVILCEEGHQSRLTSMVTLDNGFQNQTTVISDLQQLTIESGFLINSGDQLHPLCAHSIKLFKDSGNETFYVDTDMLEKNERTTPRFLPDWNQALQFTTGYIRTGCWFSNVDILKPMQLTVSHQTIAQIFSQLSLTRSAKVAHLPLVLVHQTDCNDWSLKLYSESLRKLLPPDVDVVLNKSIDTVTVKWPITSTPLVSIIIPTKNAKTLVKACIDSILEKTTYSHFEILLIDNNSDEVESLAYFSEVSRHPKIRLIQYPQSFNYSAINNFAVSHAKGSIIALVNNDIEVISAEWLTSMLGWVMQKDIGCVGAKLLYADSRIQHAGVVLGYGGGAGHAHKYFPRYHPGYLNRLAASGDYSAVTAACLLVKKADYLAVGGFEESLRVAFNDVDFCLKILSLGKRNIYCAEAELYHLESISRGLEDTIEKRDRFESELSYIQTKWQSYIVEDPAYNRNLTLSRENFSIRE
jgi:O-antigen biosynthesis protein